MLDEGDIELILMYLFAGGVALGLFLWFGGS